jgi:phosphoadenosine phosphosulfate reductase
MKTALAFSGGKDSWACLWLSQAQLPEITVLWVNTGKNYPETLELVEQAKTLCPNFIEIASNRAFQNEVNGIPADVVPIRWTRLGQSFSGKKPVTIQPYLNCCYENISHPLNNRVQELGITHLITGQRNTETHKGAMRHGQVINGVTHLHPIETWTDLELFTYLRTKMVIPEHFKIKHSSLDCYDCTAYSHESEDRIEYTKEKYPELYEQYLQRKTAVDSAIIEELQWK